MMGAAIAYVCAKAGIEVVLKDVVAGGRRPRQGLLARSSSPRRVARGRTTQEKGDALLAPDHRRPTDAGRRRRRRPRDRGRLRGPGRQGAGLRRDRAAPRRRRAARLEHLDAADHRPGRGRLAPGRLHRAALLLARWTRCRCWRSSRASRPATRRSTARSTSPSRSARRRSSSTTPAASSPRRVIGTFINEGIAMLAEGVPAPSIEQASSQAGYPAPVLQLSDELNLKLMAKIRKATRAAIEAAGGDVARPPGRRGHRPHARRGSARASCAAPASTTTRTASAPACGRACATRSRRSPTRRTIVAARTSRSGCCSSRRSRRSSASTRA